ncbi:hypothetical protein GQ42DRAFT_161813 [Ramicandelaber brevisporus]|nr:hypothetical protein GQ42DRAFT_161813 [Ramicandelaber brevisporus]
MSADSLRKRNSPAATAAAAADGKAKTKADIANPEAVFEPPNFTIAEVRAAVPAHCFERSNLISFGYVFVDLVFVALFAWLASHIDEAWFPAPLRFVAWPLYWFCQGCVCTGLWVCAHECGHYAFSPSKTVNDWTGFVLHTALLVPYHSWRITHSNHHKRTNHMTLDQVFVPKTRDYLGVAEDDERITPAYHHDSIYEDSPIYVVGNILGYTLLGWPMYLWRNAHGPSYAKGESHLSPDAKLFEPRHRNQIIASVIGIYVMLGVLGYASYLYGAWAVFKYYFVPYINVNFWLVTITYLQHTHAEVPHYTDAEWTFLRGALSTIDRDFGFLNIVFHHITDTHVAHHVFSQMPHYHAQEATAALKKKLGKHYHFDSTPWYKALYNCMARCKFVDYSDGNIMFYRHLAAPAN